MGSKISAPVGEGGKNNRNDVIIIQTLLNKWLDTPLAINGVCNGKADDPTVIAIRNFQTHFSKNPDGRVDPGGRTLEKLDRKPFLLLPQMCGFGYYSYGKGSWNERQWGTAETIGTLEEISRQFNLSNPLTLVPIGDISFQFGGEMKPHNSHREGKNVDIRPLRKDNAMAPVNYKDTTNYDQDKTKALIELFLSHKNVRSILFNDPVINALKGVSPWQGHDDHFHINMKG
ncbi:MAG: penicillin-insensitive murein endopeptidase [Pyrinomonadaceae bacterium]